MNKIEFINKTLFKIKDLELLKEILNYTISKEKVKDPIFSVVFVNNHKIKKINKKYRGINKSTDVITLDEAEYFLRQDVAFAEKEVSRHNLNINQNQFDALVSFVFNLGVGNFARSTLLRKIKSNPNDPTIRKEFERWIYAGGKVLNGLVRRRREEADLYFTK